MKNSPRMLIAVLVLLLAFAVFAQAQNVRRVSGTVTEAETGEPIEGVEITAFMVNQPNTKITDTTDKKGKYTITGLVPGLAAFQFEKYGYEPFQISRRLSSTAVKITMNAKLVKIKREEGTVSPEISEKYNEGVELFKAGNLDEALAIFEQLVADYPDLYEVHLNIGIILQGKEDYDKALEHYRIALEHNPDNENALIYVAEVYLAQRNFEEALIWYIKAAEVKPDLYYVIGQIADVARFIENYEVAVEYYNKAIALDPTKPMPYLYVGTLYNLQDNYADSVNMLIKYIEVDPAGPASSNAKAMIDDMMEKWDGAVAHLNGLVSADDSRALIHYYLGKVLAFNARNDEARTHLNRYLELDAENKYGENDKANEMLTAL